VNPIAIELNAVLDGTVAGRALSALGRRMYFPKGIIAQAAEARKAAHTVDATIGIATERGSPMSLSAIREALPGLVPAEVFPYAPTAGFPKLREAWQRETLAKNPGLSGKPVSLPVVTSGLSHGIAILADLFLDPGDPVILPDLCWDNYELIMADRLAADIRQYPLFDAAGAFNVDGLAAQLAKVRGGKAFTILNFPNNPTGYTLKADEAMRLVAALRAEAEQGTALVVVCDDAYFGLFYEEGIRTESVFTDLADLHSNILAIKTDAATKEELVWGLRVGFMSFASKDLEARHHEALIQKTMGLIRASISCSSTPGQALVLKAIESASHDAEKAATFATIKARYIETRRLVGKMTGPLRALPFNSGYFMTFVSPKGRTETLRRLLLDSYGVGTISFQDSYLRVAYSSVDLEKLPALFGAIDEAARSCCS
jgi:aspartate/methionine/tyrosine aminotransferase